MATAGEGAQAARRAAERPFSALTLAELRAKTAGLELEAEKLREEQKGRVAVSPATAALGRSLVSVAERAAEYAALVRMAQERGVEQ